MLCSVHIVVKTRKLVLCNTAVVTMYFRLEYQRFNYQRWSTSFATTRWQYACKTNALRTTVVASIQNDHILTFRPFISTKLSHEIRLMMIISYVKINAKNKLSFWEFLYQNDPCFIGRRWYRCIVTVGDIVALKQYRWCSNCPCCSIDGLPWG